MGTIRFRALVSGAVAALLVAGAVTVATAPAEARPADGGSGRFGSAIDWIEWGANRQVLPDTGFTGTTTQNAGAWRSPPLARSRT